ncbi:glycoside hydrolase family 76 protein [Melanomma pulvis-pyrius CBS 109.77]|uniref:Glycoside hydrolase family 76 protein n=1 Tax=Melanomma pulvis-pyrius CBS 109.77 TaxID=1314802 RepID=A0A6A6XFK3_9PLEO|nr:glycoside hydrolase family 76 protein [Melanomma pulvis-pyrius CBS 109.77]
MILRVVFASRPIGGILLLLALFTLLASALKNDPLVDEDHDSGYETEHQNVFHPHRPFNPKSPPSYQKPAHDAPPPLSAAEATNALQELHNALEVMQTEYFSLWLGKWTSAIDWTAAVMGTHVSATLYSLSHSLSYTMPGTFDKERKLDVEAQMVENEINKYFTQSVTYFFGEEYFSLRTQANDDMLWVVLGWLESIQFIGSHSDRHYPPTSDVAKGESEWHGAQFISPFAHRARVFYELASKGWDWELCGGGMTWDPHVLPYKNAITNQLFISASIGMYLHFPGDDNCSPFMGARDGSQRPDWKAFRAQEQGDAVACGESTASRSTYDPIYLANAIHGYDWLKNSGMTNEQGLYVDGFHIRGYATNHSKTHCDERNEMVYTYNQGVILSGLRGLWEATGNLTYLEDGHELVRNVIRATGWTDTEISTAIFLPSESPPQKPKAKSKSSPSTPSWSGLGSSGILTELCDPSGLCSQNGHTFKGIFFHHLVSFCTPLPKSAVRPGKTHAASRVTVSLHRRSCNEYAPWVLHNARAAGETRDTKGRFGMWWGAGIEQRSAAREEKKHDDGDGSEIRQKQEKRRHRQFLTRSPPPLPKGALDYRNDAAQLASFLPHTFAHVSDRDVATPAPDVQTVGSDGDGDPNTRGRGRTVETQGGGVAVTRAMWEFLRRYEDDDE